MEKKKVFNIFICIAAIAIIVYFFMNQFGYVSQIKEVQEDKKKKTQSRVWEGKAVGDMEMKLKISDMGKIFDDFDAGFLKITAKSDKFKYTCSTEQQQNIDNLKKLSYDDVQKFGVYQPGENGDYSKNMYYFCFVPKDCKYVMAGKDKFDVQNVKLDTKTDGKLECKVCLFYIKPQDAGKEYHDSFVVMYDENGKRHDSVM